MSAMNIWHTVGQISSGFGLAAFLAAVALQFYRTNLSTRLQVIKALPQEQRAEAVNRELNSFNIDASNLTKEQKFKLLEKELELRGKRMLYTTIVIVIVALISGGVTAYAFTMSATVPGNGKVWLKIKGVTTDLPGKSLVQIAISVNGVSFRYPGQQAVEWLETGPDMVTEQYKISQNSTYSISFTGKIKDKDDKVYKAVGSQETVVIEDRELPAELSYEIYSQDYGSHTHSRDPIGIILYTVARDPN